MHFVAESSYFFTLLSFPQAFFAASMPFDDCRSDVGNKR